MKQIQPTDISTLIDSKKLLAATLDTVTIDGLERLMTGLPVVPEGEYRFNPDDPTKGWQPGKLHWYPVGGMLGNQSNIKHAGSAVNPIGERVVNAFEALIELEREKELLIDDAIKAPTSPRDAVRQYFDLPPLDEIPDYTDPIRGMKADQYVRTLARRILVTLKQQAKGKEYTVTIEDNGIGQRADRIHKSVLSLTTSDKPDKAYLIGMFGQGGSSAFAACESSLARQPAIARTAGSRRWKGRLDAHQAIPAAAPTVL